MIRGGVVSKIGLAKLYKRDLMGSIILKRKSLIILIFLKKLSKISKKAYKKKRNKKNLNFFRILNIPRPVYFRRRTKYGKYFFLRQQFRIYYGFLRIRTLQIIIKKSFKRINSLNYFLYLLESRLDVILFRLYFTSSVRMSRQLIAHGQVLVNFKILYNPNYNLKTKDVLTFTKKGITTKKLSMYYKILSSMWPIILIPAYIEFNLDYFLFKFLRFNLYDIPFFIQTNSYTFLSIMNFYTRYYF